MVNKTFITDMFFQRNIKISVTVLNIIKQINPFLVEVETLVFIFSRGQQINHFLWEIYWTYAEICLTYAKHFSLKESHDSRSFLEQIKDCWLWSLCLNKKVFYWIFEKICFILIIYASKTTYRKQSTEIFFPGYFYHP